MSIHITVFYVCVLAAYGITGVEMCNPDEFQCSDGQCIDASFRCNDYFNCNDTSDEINCTTSDKCREGLYRCLNGECIDLSKNNCTDITTEQFTSESTSSTLESSTKMYQTTDGQTSDVSSTSKILSTIKMTTPSNSHTDITTIKTSPKAGIIPDEDNDDTGIIIAVVLVCVVVVILIILAVCYFIYDKNRRGFWIVNYVQRRFGKKTDVAQGRCQKYINNNKD